MEIFLNFLLRWYEFQEAESILNAGAIPTKDAEYYFSEDEDTPSVVSPVSSSIDPREE